MSGVIETFVHDHMYLHLVLIALAVGAMLVAMAVDLVFGVQKAKERGEARNSTGYKKTASKAKKYFSPLMVLICVDLICCIIIPIPAFSLLWAAYCVWCEFVSVREKSWQKAELRKAEKTMSVIIENKDDIAALVAEILFKKEGGQKDETN